MKIVLKEGLEINDPISNKLSLDYFKKLVNNELKKVDKINSLINEELTDEEYMDKMLSIYELKFGDFGGVKDSNMIYTQIPYYSEVDEKPMWHLRAYQTTSENSNLLFLKPIDENKIKDLVEDGVVLLDVTPYERVRYEYTFIQRNALANKIPVLSNMNENDANYKDFIIKALRDYSKEDLIKDKNNILNKLKSTLERIKSLNDTSISVTKERLNIENQIEEYCNDKLNETKTK